jgi:glycosyltransferase involved in cell wall biosynthesis
MKILHVISSMNPAGGGAVEGMLQLGTVMRTLGDEIEIASLDSPGAAYLKDIAIPVHPLGPPKSGFAYSKRFVPWLRANRSRYDSVVVNGIWQFQSFGAWQALRNSSTPYFLFTHGMLDPWFKKQYPMKHLKKWMYWPWAEYRVLRDARAVLFTCEEERRLARTSFWLYRCNEVVVNYGTSFPKGDPEMERGAFFAKHPELQGKKIVLFLGRIHPKKGCDLLISAFAKMLAGNREWQLVMAGPDQTGWQKELEARAATLKISGQVTWTGMLAGAEKWGALRAAEVFALPSHQENFGIAVAESLAVGLPVLISNQVNIWREVEGDKAGFVGADTLEGTCDMLQSYLRMTPSERHAMRLASLRCFEQRFEIHTSAKILQNILQAACRN